MWPQLNALALLVWLSCRLLRLYVDMDGLAVWGTGGYTGASAWLFKAYLRDLSHTMGTTTPTIYVPWSFPFPQLGRTTPAIYGSTVVHPVSWLGRTTTAIYGSTLVLPISTTGKDHTCHLW
ncbi:hypothetical protein B0H13DRAFT_1851228 [Mycena leptocephala]|nr:hypothetical protein B0H13DRAFT_1851228 [Mycena leptocephala]